MTKRQEHLRRRLVRGAPRAAAVGAAAAAVCLVCLALNGFVRRILVRDSSGAQCLLMAAPRAPQALMAQAGLEPQRPEDTVTLDWQRDGSLLLAVQRGFPVTIEADGKTIETVASSGTVAELLESAGVALGADDEVTPARSAAITPEMGPVRVARVRYQEYQKEEVVPFEVEYRDDSETTEGRYLREIVEQEGADGLAEVTYRKKYVDGVYTETQTVHTEVLAEMKPEVHHKFYTDAVSPLPPPEGITVVDNVPSSYTTVYSMKSTGYYSPRGRGASGLGLYYGTFACDPTLIPYGTKVYIASPDGSFVYGWAIATDTGGFALTNPMQVDLFYETYAESAAHGVKQVNVYIP